MVGVPLHPINASLVDDFDTPSSSVIGKDDKLVDDLSCTLRNEPSKSPLIGTIPLDHPPIPENSRTAVCPVTGAVVTATGHNEIRTCPVTGAIVLTAANNATTVSIGSRSSQLALAQTSIVAKAMQSYHASLEFPVFATKTAGDRNKILPLYTMGKSLWTKELETFLIETKVDLVVHSLKDLPTTLPEGCILGAILERKDPSDAVIIRADLREKYSKLHQLPPGSVVGTSSKRRIAQLRRLYPHLKIKDMRGNIDSRIRKLNKENSDYSCILLAAAGLYRLGLDQHISHILDSEYAVGQGALAVEIREGDLRTKQLLAPLRHPETTSCCIAERALMRSLEGGCSVPIGVKTTLKPESAITTSSLKNSPRYGQLTLIGVVVSVNGDKEVRGQISRRVRILNQSRYDKQYLSKQEQELFPLVDLDEEVMIFKDADTVGVDLANELIAKGAASILAEKLPEESSTITSANGHGL